MTKFIAIALLIMSFNSYADFIFTPGVFGTMPMDSDEKASSGKKVLDTNGGGGFLVNLDWIVFSPLTIGFGAGYSGRAGKVQYKNADATANDLNASVTQFNLEAGAKLRLINTKYFKVFVGGGAMLGSMIMTFDEEKFEAITGSDNGFEEGETKGYNGYYLDAGVEYILSNTGGLRFSAKKNSIDTGEYENLDNKALTLDYMSYSIQYMHYVNWDFFWK